MCFLSTVILAFICPSLAFGMTQARINGGDSCGPCCVHCCCCPTIYGCLARGRLRNRFSIYEGSCANCFCDYLAHHCLCWCAIAQEEREIIYRMDQPVVMAAPMVAVAMQPTMVIQQQQPVQYAQPAYAQPAQQQQMVR